MDFEQLLAQLRAQRATADASFRALDSEGQSILATAQADNARALTEAENARSLEIVTERRAARELLTQIDARIAEVEAERDADAADTAAAQRSAPGADAPRGGTQHARTNEREATYSRRKQVQEGVSFFTDMYRQQMGMASPETQARLQAHSGEMADARTERAVATGGLGGLVPPQYLVDLAAPIARAGRVTADIVRHLPLPAEGMSIIVPRQTTGATTAVQANQNTNVSSTDIAVTDLTVPIVTIAGQQDVSRQSLERGAGVDELIFADIVAAYNVNLDAQVLAGTGSGGQMLGILNTAGTTQMAAFAAAAAADTFWKKLAGAIVAVQTGRFLAPTGIVMHPRRWGWLTSLVDSANRPLVVPNQNGPSNAQGHYNEPLDTNASAPVGWMQGVPVYTDANLPTSVGTGPEDQVVVARLEDLLLWEENGGVPRELRFEQTLGNQLTVKLVAYGYAAFTAGRYPLATALIGGNAGAGNGLIAPTF